MPPTETPPREGSTNTTTDGTTSGPVTITGPRIGGREALPAPLSHTTVQVEPEHEALAVAHSGGGPEHTGADEPEGWREEGTLVAVGELRAAFEKGEKEDVERVD